MGNRVRTSAPFRVYIFSIFVLTATPGVSETDARRVIFEFMPGDAREVTHRDSASTDTALIAYEVAPRVSVTTGGDIGFFLFEFGLMSLRIGLFGMFELSTLNPDRLNFLTVPSGPYLWRGLLGYSLALSFDDVGRRLLGLDGALEIALSFRHESEHVTHLSGFNASAYDGAPHIGDFLMLDIAARKVAGAFVIKARIQQKVFLPTYDNYVVGPGGDLVCQWWALPWFHPFVSVFGEYLFGKNAPDAFIVRSLMGAIFPGRRADVQVYFVLAYGHDKGVLVLEKGLRYGYGIRVGVF